MGQIVNVKCTRIRFDPGDRLLARIYKPLSREDLQKMRRSLQEWVGRDDVEILIVDGTQIDIGVLDATGRPIPSTPPDEIPPSHQE